MATPKQHIEEIRRNKFSIGGTENPLTEDLHHAVKNLSAELYAKDVHFLLEIIQNAEDNEYPEGVGPSLEFIITSRDITATGAPATLLIFNNEKGFSPKNIDSICSIGRSTKKGNRKRGYIGEKGIGFKSVFLITARPYIFSNGYQIRFNEAPCQHCNLGYIVPEWVEGNPSLSDIKQIYGAGATLPTTTIVLPLKPEKAGPVRQQLLSIHPEVLLFLLKIKHLSVKEDCEDPLLGTVNAISISSETNFVTRKNIDAESYTLYLSANDKGDHSDQECSYYMWKQKFPVKPEHRVERRMDVEEWVITLAFPNGQRLHRGTSSPGVYAFLPTEMVTNFPFIIQADFLLPSSRETILLDDRWNQGILHCVPIAFLNAFTSFVKLTADAPVSSLAPLFKFLPTERSSYPRLNVVRDSIREKLMEENIIPSESYTEQKVFHKPSEVGRIMPAFWEILKKARTQKVNLYNLSSHGRYILSSSFDKEEYDQILAFLKVGLVGSEWYGNCIRSSTLVLKVSEDVYLELLLFIADNWRSKFDSTNIRNVPLVKYVGLDQSVSLCSINESISEKGLYLSSVSNHSSWLIDWNREFRCASNRFFMPKSTRDALEHFGRVGVLWKWLKEDVKVGIVDVNNYAFLLSNSLNSDCKLVITYAHFLFHSLSGGYFSSDTVKDLCNVMPLVDDYGQVTKSSKGTIFPAAGSKWASLMCSNIWRSEGYVVLGEEYLQPGIFAGQYTPEKKLATFLVKHAALADIPFVSAPNSDIPAFSAPLTKENVFLLLDWIRYMKSKGIHIPGKFLKSIKEGSWLKTVVGRCCGYRPPSQSFLLSSEWEDFWQSKSVLVDIPVIDKSFYGDRITGYKEELKSIGVMFEYGEACDYIGRHLMSLASTSSLTRSNVLSLLNFIKFLRKKYLPVDEFVHRIRDVAWMITCCGYKSPAESVLLDRKWSAASQISDIPFINQEYYGVEILHYEAELELLGVIVGFKENYELVVRYLRSTSALSSITSESFLLMLQCLRHSAFKNKIIHALTATKCVKTNIGYKYPSECFLQDPDWGCLLQVFNSFPLIDESFYGRRILCYKGELKDVGVVVDFEKAAEVFILAFRQQASSSSITKESALLLLACYRRLKGASYRIPSDLRKCITEQKWLQTRLFGYKSPKESILFSPEWKSISRIARLPFIDDGDDCYGPRIHEFRKELKQLGVVVNFKEGTELVAARVCLPRDPHRITSENAFSLLECITILLKKGEPLSDDFLLKVSKPWLKTNAGYRSPDECLLFDSEWGPFLRPTDGAFIDENFYGSKILSYKKELDAIGVIVDVKKGCSLIARHLDCLAESTTIVRIYKYLAHFKWQPGDRVRRIWIPVGDGKWVGPEACVLHDRDGLFSQQLNVLEKHYERELLSFFSSALEVTSNPSIEDYCVLWQSWESAGSKLSLENCEAFWSHVTGKWSEKVGRILADKIEKIPVRSSFNEVLLVDKHNVFIADDLQLKDLFEEASSHPLFAWYPQTDLLCLPRNKLLEIYRKIGVRVISECVQREDGCSSNSIKTERLSSCEDLIGKELVRLILAFLAQPSLETAGQKRHEAVQELLNSTVFETTEAITVRYRLDLSGEPINVEASQMIYWDRSQLKVVTQKIGCSDCQRTRIEFATYFSEVISKGVLWDKEEHIGALSELIKLAFLLDFNAEAIGFLMKSRNLQIFMEDDKFLSSVFLSP